MKQLSTLFLVIIFVLLSGMSAQAESLGAAAEFREAARSIPTALIQAGYSKIGKINLKTVLKNIENIQVDERDWVETAMDGGQKRIFARWERSSEGPKVIINTTTWGQAFPEHHAALALHEILGAHGFQDHDYNLSTAMWLLVVDAQKKAMNSAERRYVENAISKMSKESTGGGVIGVGGGGDMMGPSLKLTMLQSAYNAFEKNRSEENRAGIFKKFQVTQMFSVEGAWKWR